MSIQKLPIALEMYSVREEFAKAPEETLVRIRRDGLRRRRVLWE